MCSLVSIDISSLCVPPYVTPTPTPTPTPTLSIPPHHFTSLPHQHSNSYSEGCDPLYYLFVCFFSVRYSALHTVFLLFLNRYLAFQTFFFLLSSTRHSTVIFCSFLSHVNRFFLFFSFLVYTRYSSVFPSHYSVLQTQTSFYNSHL